MARKKRDKTPQQTLAPRQARSRQAKPRIVPLGPVGFQKRPAASPTSRAAERTREPDTVVAAARALRAVAIPPAPTVRPESVRAVPEGNCKTRPRNGRSKGGRARAFVPHCGRRK